MIVDVLLLLVIAGIVTAAAAEGLIRTILMVLLFYMLSLLLGALMLGFGLANTLNDIVVGSLGGAQKTPLFYQTILFVALLVPSFVGGIVLSHLALDDTSIRGLRWADNVLGTVVGLFLGLAFAAVLCNAWGVMVSETWRPVAAWADMRRVYDASLFQPYMMDVLRIYRRLLFPFAATGYPIFFRPQAQTAP